MPDRDTIREEQVQKAVQLLKDKPEVERETFIEVLALTPAEKEEVRRRLWAPPPLRPPKPEVLREMETFQRLVQDVRRGKAILFLGAGVSQDVGMPSSGALVDVLRSLAKSYHVSLHLEEQEYTLPTIAGLLERESLRHEVIETLKDRFDEAFRSQAPPPYHKGCYRLLPYLGELNKVILTTNWDDLLELAFRETGVATIRRDRELPSLAATAHAVVKLHGDFTDPNTLIVSDTDYVRARNAISRPGELAGSLWGTVSTLLAQNSCIFAGYRSSDEDMQLLRSLVATRQMGVETRNYMVGLFDESEQKGLKDWLRMEVIPATASQFFVALAQELAEFANRRDDLDRIFRREASLFLEFYAPFGAGKHALLDEVERRAKSEGWKDEQTIRIDLRLEPRPLTAAGLTQHMAKAIGQPWIQRGEQLSKALRDKRRLLILFEHTEAIETGWKELTTFVNGVVAPVVRELDESGRHSRLILSGRYPIEDWPFSFKRDAEVFPLSPFTLSAVREMVGKYTLFHDPQAAIASPSSQLVKQIYDLTGRSHPGFIKQILDDLMRPEKPDSRLELPPALTEQEIDEHLASFMGTIHKEVWTTVPSEIGELFVQGLCVLRRLNAGLLARLAQEDAFRDLFGTVGKPEDVINWLKKCHLLAYEFPLEVADPTIRRIPSYVLRRGKPERFALTHRAAASAWKSLLPSVEDLTQLRYFREWLYHQASYLQIDGKTEEFHWEVMQKEVETVQFRTSQPYPVKMGETLLKDVEEKKERDKERDEELYDALLASLGEVYYEQFRQLLLAKPEITR
jgi:hypothetical protein